MRSPNCLIYRESLAFQTGFRTVLCLGFHFQLYLSIQSIYQLVSTQDSGIKINGNIYIQVISQTFEYRIIRNHKRYVQVSGRSTIHTFATVTFQFNDLPVCHAGRNGNTYILPVYSQHLFMSLGCITKREV
mgnify:CR=1 FL=1